VTDSERVHDPACTAGEDSNPGNAASRPFGRYRARCHSGFSRLSRKHCARRPESFVLPQRERIIVPRVEAVELIKLGPTRRRRAS